jgi:hypothetical protein
MSMASASMCNFETVSRAAVFVRLWVAVCLPGYGVQGGGWPCQVCQVDYYSPGGTSPCKPCPPGTTTLMAGQSSCGE